MFLSACGFAILCASSPANAQDVTYEYDALGRLKSATYTSGDIEYDYDAVGNRTLVTVGISNIPPNAVNDSFNQTHSTTVDRDVLANDTDANGDTLTITAENSGYASIVSNKLRFAAPAASGTYNVTYTISDGDGSTDTAIATFTVPNVAPIALPNNNLNPQPGQIFTHNPLWNDTDPNGDALTIISETSSFTTIVTNKLRIVAPLASGVYNNTYTIEDTYGAADSANFRVTVPNVAPSAVNNSYTQAQGTTVDRDVLANDTDPNGDTLTITAENSGYASIVNNKLRFVAPAASGTYNVTYTISDGNGSTDTAVATFTVSNVAPNAVNDSYTQTHSTTVDRNVLGNDTDPNGDTLTITAENSGYASIVSNKLRFAAPAASGTYNVTYTISDGNGSTDTAVATFTVPNVAPNAVANSYTQTHSTTVDRDVLANDTDPNGDTLTITAENSGYASIVNNKLRFAAPATSGTYNVTYTISDGNGSTDTAVATFTVPNVAPNAVNNSYTQNGSTTVDHNVLGNDTDANGDSLTLVSENNGNASVVNNKLRFNAPSSAGTHTVTYTISDQHGGTDTATATITVQVPNGPPVANADTPGLTWGVGPPAQIDVLANDTDPDGDTLTITSTTIGFISGNVINFIMPSANGFYSGTYTVSDGNGHTDTASLTIYVTGFTGWIPPF